ncbi:unnamed protein product [Calypogeia fissa]
MAAHSLRNPIMFLSVLAVVLLCSRPALVNATSAWAVTDWTSGAHATYYGGDDASGTMGGACGYGNLYSMGYGTESTALSNPLFNNGLTCGACFELQCVLSETQWCYPGKTIVVTATNACPPGSTGGWCDPPRLHFDLSYPMFTTLAQAVGGVIPVQYKRVPCSKQGGIRFQIQGNAWWQLVLVTNVGGGGDVQQLAVKGNGGWMTASRNWGQNWQVTGTQLDGCPLSFRVTLGNGQSLTCNNVAPSSWHFGQIYECGSNF